MLGGMVVSALAHPLFLATLAWLAVAAAFGGPAPAIAGALGAVDWFSVLASYLAFMTLGLLALTGPERAGATRTVLSIPVYWAALSVAAWRALIKIVREPHVWEKTAHTPSADRPA
jgi:hypothetical protein